MHPLVPGQLRGLTHLYTMSAGRDCRGWLAQARRERNRLPQRVDPVGRRKGERFRTNTHFVGSVVLGCCQCEPLLRIGPAASTLILVAVACRLLHCKVLPRRRVGHDRRVSLVATRDCAQLDSLRLLALGIHRTSVIRREAQRFAQEGKHWQMQTLSEQCRSELPRVAPRRSPVHLRFLVWGEHWYPLCRDRSVVARLARAVCAMCQHRRQTCCAPLLECAPVQRKSRAMPYRHHCRKKLPKMGGASHQRVIFSL